MRAVLRATFAARRRARPTAAENSLLLRELYLRFIVNAPAIEEYDPSYHTHSTCRLKACNVFQSGAPRASLSYLSVRAWGGILSKSPRRRPGL